MLDPSPEIVDIDGATLSEKLALGVIISKCRDKAVSLDLSLLACLLERAALAVDEDVARIAVLPGRIDCRPQQ